MKIKGNPILLLIILLASNMPLAFSPSTEAQSTGNTVNVPLTFHAYSLMLRDPNGSLYVYDGADGAPPDQTAATQVNLDAQISGSRDTFIGPVAYWSAVVMWGIKLPMDVHVKGNVNVHVYIGSTAKLSGMFSGGGYAMGLVDVDENNVEVKEFLKEADYTIGTNPFTATPSQYSLTINEVDYTFKKGHFLCLVIGLGATTQGFTATVYFGSQDKNSGATLPVVDTTETQAFTVNADQTIAVTSNSAVSNFQFDSATRSISFLAQGIPYTAGTCTVAVPKILMQPPFTATSGSQPLSLSTTENSTHYQLAFTHTRTAETIKIAGTAPTQTATPTQTSAPSQTASSTAIPSPPLPEINTVTGLLMLFIVTTAAVALLLLKRKTIAKR